MEKLDITKILAKSTAKFFESEAGKALIQAELAKLLEGEELLEYLTTEETPTESKPKTKQKASKPPKVDFKGQDKLIEDLHEHYDDFDNSALRAKALKIFNKATLRACVLAFASANKFSELDAWATKLRNKELQAWWKKQS